jgi:hypothetical protein
MTDDEEQNPQPAGESQASGEQPASSDPPQGTTDTQPTVETEQSDAQSGESPGDDTKQATADQSDQAAQQADAQSDKGDGGTAQDAGQPAKGDQPAAQSDDKPGDDSVSAARARVINEILPEVMGAKYKHGSQEDQAKFNRLLPGVDIEDQIKATPGYTTCGALPAYVLNRLGGVTDKGVLCGGLGGVRDGIPDKQGKLHGGAKALGAWVDNDGSTPPKPGDIYILEGPIHYTDKATGQDQTITGIRHIGIIVSISTTTNDDNTVDWKTADAGQGTGVNQEADYQIRKYDSQAKTVTGKADKGTVVGWVDLDLLLAKSAGN